MWAKIDDPEAYSKIISNELSAWIDKSLTNGDSWDVAKVVYEMYKTEYICINADKKLWYYYNSYEHRWNELADAMLLRRKLSVEVYGQYKNREEYFSMKSSEAGDTWHAKKEKISKITLVF